MKRMQVFLILCCVMSMLAAGCGFTMPDMTEEEASVIAEYAASLLLKYDKNYDSNLAVIQEETEEMEKEPEVSSTEPEKEDESVSKKEEGTEAEKTEEPVSAETIQDFYGLEGLEFSYAGCIFADSYSGHENSEFVLAFDASEGNTLAVLEFNVENVSTEPIVLDMLSLNPRMRMEIGGIIKRVQPTMLINDMTTYNGIIQPGETICLALVAEYDEGTLQSEDSISLLLRNDSTNATIYLN